MNLLKSIRAAYTDDKGEIQLISVMVTLLFILFLILFIKAEFLSLAYSEGILDSIVLLIQIALGAVGVGHVGRKWAPGLVDLVNRKRAGIIPPPGEKPPSVEPPVKPKPKPTKLTGLNSLARWAEKFLGLKEVPGEGSNPQILHWITQMGWIKKYPTFQSDSDAWCSLFPNAGAKELGLEYSDSPAAKSWLSVGRAISHEEIMEKGVPESSGIIAVYHRGNIYPNRFTGPGHNKIVTELYEGGKFTGIGGNESDQIKKSHQDIQNPEFIEFRLLT